MNLRGNGLPAGEVVHASAGNSGNDSRDGHGIHGAGRGYAPTERGWKPLENGMQSQAWMSRRSAHSMGSSQLFVDMPHRYNVITVGEPEVVQEMEGSVYQGGVGGRPGNTPDFSMQGPVAGSLACRFGSAVEGSNGADAGLYGAAEGLSCGVAPDPFGHEVKHFTDIRVLSREVGIVLEGVDKLSSLISSVYYPDGDSAKDLGLELVQNGLAKFVEWSASMMEDDAKHKLKYAELQAKKDRLRIWTNYVPPPTNLKAIHDSKFTGKVVEVVSGDCLIFADDVVPTGVRKLRDGSIF